MNNYHRTLGTVLICLCLASSVIGQSRDITGASPGATQTIGGIKFRWCPAGKFRMGSPQLEKGRFGDETTHEVTLSRGFWMAETEVTQGQWKSVFARTQLMQASVALNSKERIQFRDNKSQTFRERANLQRVRDMSQYIGDEVADAPVYFVNWNEAQLFCKTLTKKEQAAGRLPKGWEFRLPTEAQWEYACRAGRKTAIYSGPMSIRGAANSPELDRVGWYGGNSGRGLKGKGFQTPQVQQKQYADAYSAPRRVGQKTANPWGLKDMLGNVWEWCQDGYTGNYSAGAAKDPIQSSGATRLMRGGSWSSDAAYCRAASRMDESPLLRFNNIGFRVAVVATGDSAGNMIARTTAAPLSPEAEDAKLLGTAHVDKKHAGFEGTGFVEGLKAVGSGVEMLVSGGSAGGPCDLRIRYSAADPNRKMSLSINGTIAQRVSLAQTKGWQDWGVKMVKVKLKPGANKVRLHIRKGDVGPVNLDSVTAMQNRAIRFDKQTYVRITPKAPHESFYTSNYTIEGWFKASDESYKEIFRIKEVGTKTAYFTVPIHPGGVLKVRNRLANNTFKPSTANTRVNDQKWHHFAYVVDWSKVEAIYIDGVLQKAHKRRKAPAKRRFYILLGGFNGYIDELRIWNFKKTTPQINADMKRSVSSSTPGLITHCGFDRFRSSELLDEAGNPIAKVTTDKDAPVTASPLEVVPPLDQLSEVRTTNSN